MNKIAAIFLTSVVTITENVHAMYDCTGGSFGPITVQVFDASVAIDRSNITSYIVVINDKDRAKVNNDDLSDGRKKSVRLEGHFSTLGDGKDGYTVDVKVTKYMLRDSDVAYLTTYNKGPEGFYSDSYKCIKR